jgi:HlyD family secretion protein
MRHRIHTALVPAFLLALTLSGCAGLPSLQPTTPPTPRAPTTVAVTRGDVEQAVTGPGQLVGTQEQTLGAPVSARIASIAVQPGAHVHAGDTLATFDSTELAARVEKERASFVVAQAEYSNTVRSATPAQIQAARAALASAQASHDALLIPPNDNTLAALRAKLRNAEAALKIAQAGYDNAFAFNPAGINGSPAALELEHATNEHDVARAEYDKAFEPAGNKDLQAARARISETQAALAALAPVSSTAALAQARLDAAALALRQAESELGRAVITAPGDGVVLEIKARAGDLLQSGAPLFVITNPAALEVKVSVLEEDYPLLKPGQRAQLFFDAAPDADVQAVVARISPQRLAGDRPLYPVYLTLPVAPAGLAAGMSVDASITIARVSAVLRLPRAVVRAGAGDKATVDVWENNQRTQRAVRVGLRGNTHVEIVDGLREGELVVGE